jgi:ABC-type sugar transport system ATPase subunit
MTVTLVEELGHEELIHGAVEGAGRLVVRLPASRHRDEVTTSAVGSTLAVTFDPADVHLFDAVTEARIDA